MAIATMLHAYGYRVIDVDPDSTTAIETALETARLDTESDTLEIRLHEGTYRIAHPLAIGTDMTSDGQVLRITGAGMGRTIVSGGCDLPKFTAISDSLWAIDLGGTPFALADIQYLYVNGNRATLARTPNTDRLYNNFSASQLQVDSVPVRAATRNGLYVHTIKLPTEAVKALSEICGPVERTRISFLHAWDMTRRHIETFNPAEESAYVIGSPMKPWNPIDRDAQFFIENDRSFLDAPGEWYYDRDECKLYYIPRSGEQIGSAVATVPLLSSLLTITGTPGNKTGRIHLSDLTLAYTQYPISRRGDDPVQAAARMGAAVTISHATDVTLTGCEIAHTGDGAIWIKDGSRQCSVNRCYMHDLGTGGIKIGSIQKPTDEERDLIRHITIDNNILHSGGRNFPTGAGILLTHAADNTITHNDIADFYYSGISAGWTWGYAHSPSKRNIISHNHIHHIGRGAMSDMGGIYTLGASEGTVISNNVVHHIYSYSYGGWGLYTDEGSSGILIRDNLVYECKSSAFHQHYGRDNHITNNIFANQIRAQLEATLKEDHHSFTFDRNIISFTKGNMYGLNWNNVSSTVDHNSYWFDGNGTLTFNGITLRKWQDSTGRDKHSIVADPQFKDAANGDFTVGNRSLMRKIGFKPFDQTSAGVYGDDSWRRLSQLPASITEGYDAVVEAYEEIKN